MGLHTKGKIKRELPLYIMLLPGVVILFIYCYLPMYGVKIAFERFLPAKGLFGDQEFVGLSNFMVMFSNPFAVRALINTVIIAFFKIVSNIFIPLIFSLLINELVSVKLKRTIQTLVYLPYFISWVILGQIFLDLLAVDHGMVNNLLDMIGLNRISFLGNNANFRETVIITNIWKEFGFGTVIYLAAITGIDPALYESAVVDGANRWQKAIHITIPGMSMVIVLRMVLSLGSVLNAGFDQIFNLYNPVVYETGDILDTYIYRLGLLNYQYGQSTAVGLFKSLVSLIFIGSSYWFAYKKFDYRVF